MTSSESPCSQNLHTLFSQSFESLEVCAKVLYQVGLSRSSLDQLFGFSVEAELVENTDHQDELCVYVSRVEEGSLAHQQGESLCAHVCSIHSAACLKTGCL